VSVPAGEQDSLAKLQELTRQDRNTVFRHAKSSTEIIKTDMIRRKIFTQYPVMEREWEIILGIPSRLLVFWLSQQACVSWASTAVLLLRYSVKVARGWPGF